MNSATHKTVGVSLVMSIMATEGLWHGEVLNIPVYTPVMLATVAVGSILADADMETTEMGRKMPWLSKMVTHRGLTHTPVVTAIPYILCLMALTLGASWYILVVTSLLMGLFIGYVSHVLIDTFNYNGCPIFWPVYQKNLYIFRVSTKNSFAKTKKDKKNNWQEPAFTAIWVTAIIIHTALVLGGFTL